MFRVEEIELLTLLVIVPILAIGFYLLWQWKKRQIRKLGDEVLIKRLSPDSSKVLVWTKIALFLLALSALIIALANPQYGGRKEKVKAQSSDIFIALDISQSMMSQDISPSRLERAKRFTARLIRTLKGERIGLILFAGNAYLQMPLTGDYAASELFVNAANTNQAGTQGTSFSDAIKLARDAFEPGKDSQKALIIISDGEDHEAEAEIEAENAQEEGIVIFTIAVGTEEGGYVPIVNRGREEYIMDENNQPVVSKVNLTFMADIAETTGGNFYLINQEKAVLDDIKSEINKLQKKEVEQRSFTDFSSYFQYFLMFGLVILVIEYLIPSRKKIKLDERA